MIRILLQGCMGKMGQCITRMASAREDTEIVAGVDKFVPDSTPYPVYPLAGEVRETADVAVDFTRPDGMDTLLPYCLEKKLPLLLATTALDEDRLARVQKAAGTIPIFMASNLSLGITLLRRLLPDAARTLDGFDMEIIERHHNQKVDAPSGTAVTLAKILQETRENAFPVYGRKGGQAKRQPGEIGIHAIRGGTVTGDHEVGFYGHDEVFTLSHHAASREVFATGALAAAAFLTTCRPGLYDMDDLLTAMTGSRKPEVTSGLLLLLAKDGWDKLTQVNACLPDAQCIATSMGLAVLLPENRLADLLPIFPDTPKIRRGLSLLETEAPSATEKLQTLYENVKPVWVSVTGGKLVLLVEDADLPKVLERL